MKRYYFDTSATTPVHPEVLKEMLPYFDKFYGNASSVHSFGRQAREAVEASRKKIAEHIGAEPEEIYFTSGGTEGDNLAVKGVPWANSKRGRHMITSEIEHPAVLNSCRFMETLGYSVTYLPVDKYGTVSENDLKKNLKPGTVFASIMLVNNEVGTIQPVKELAALCKKAGVLFHTDAVQAMGKIHVNIKDLNVDLLSISGHKIYGPKGIGAIYIKKGTRIASLLHGGHHEGEKRAGTENVAGIVGLAKAIEVSVAGLDEFTKEMQSLRDKLERNLLSKIKDIKINGNLKNRLPNLSNISFKAVEGEAMLLNLDIFGIAASSGSACSSGSLAPSHVLTAMGIDPVTAQGTLRFSLGRMNKEEDIDFLIDKLTETVKKLRKISPLYRNPRAEAQDN